MRRVTFHPAASISTISSDLLHATKIDEPVTEGWAQVGEQEGSPGLGGSIPWPPMSMCFGLTPVCGAFIPVVAGPDFFGVAGGPFTPISWPFVSRKCRETFSVP